jgi:sterol desaturase/sphingolipid hydroxylase (fatty acid hydroxylase superfamily)
VHSNLDLDSKGIGWLFTTNGYHFRHHSRVFEESNTNYGCAAIVWDRVFGTFAEGPTFLAARCRDLVEARRVARRRIVT